MLESDWLISKHWIALPPALAGGKRYVMKNGFSHSNNASSFSNP